VGVILAILCPKYIKFYYISFSFSGAIASIAFNKVSHTLPRSKLQSSECLSKEVWGDLLVYVHMCDRVHALWMGMWHACYLASDWWVERAAPRL